MKPVKANMFVGLFVLLQVALVKSQTTYKCSSGHDISISKEDMENMKKCGEKIGVKSMEEMTPEKIPCFAKCIMETSGLMDDQGKPHKENILKGIDEKVPAEVKEKYKKAVETCIDDHGNNISAKDETCLSYSPMAMCVTKAFKQICHG